MNRISQRQLDRLTPQVQPLLDQVAQAARAAGAASLALVCGLAEGADRHVAKLALDSGYALHAVLPFEREVYVADFTAPASRREYDALLARAAQVTELCGRRGVASQAYHRAGQVLLGQSDLLLALWDGRPAQGPGGTADVVNGACQRRMPVVHVSTHEREAPLLVWQRQGRAGRSHHSAYEAAPARPCGRAQLAATVSHLMRAG